MTKEEFENILNLQNNLKELPNTKLIEVMDKLTVTFDLTKENVISLTKKIFIIITPNKYIIIPLKNINLESYKHGR